MLSGAPDVIATLLTFNNPTPWPILGTAGLLLLEMIVFCVPCLQAQTKTI